MSETPIEDPVKVPLATIRGPQGEPGNDLPPPSITASAVTGPSNAGAGASVQGSYPEFNLHFIVPRGLQGSTGGKGDKGDKGDKGNDAPLPNLTSTATAGPAANATVSGTYPNLNFDFVVPKGDTGDKGDKGDSGPATTLSEGTVTTGPAGSQVVFDITGEAPNQVVNVTIPKGDAGGIVTAGGFTDFNTLVTPGTYTSGTSTPNRPVASARGMHVWVSGNGTGTNAEILQVAYGRSNADVQGQIWVRATQNGGGTWSPWLKQLTTNDWGSPQLSTGQDANTLLTPGRMYIASSASNLNFPFTSSAFLEVGKSGSNFYIQTYTVSGTTVTAGQQFVRSSTDGGVTWSPWQRGTTLTGVGSPEGSVSAPVGTEYTDSAVTNGVVKWIKVVGTSNVGWRVVFGDTGWRNITSMLDPVLWNVATSKIYARRLNDTVSISMQLKRLDETMNRISYGTGMVLVSGGLGAGWQSLGHPHAAPFVFYTLTSGPPYLGSMAVLGSNFDARVANGTGASALWKANDTVSADFSYAIGTNLAWPTTLPGVAI